MVNIGIAEHADEVVEREIEHAEPVYHRVGVGERTQEQHRDRVEDEKCQHGKECARPQPASDDAKSCRALGLRYRRGKCSGFCRHALPSGDPRRSL